jgi:ferritin-like metal-binding protein YciE
MWSGRDTGRRLSIFGKVIDQIHLQATLDEEGAADKKLTDSAETIINVEAVAAKVDP